MPLEIEQAYHKILNLKFKYLNLDTDIRSNDLIKIIHLITDLDIGGAEAMLHKLLLNMDRTKFENVVISMMDKGFFGLELEKEDIKVFELCMRRGKPDLLKINKLIKIIKEENPDIIQTWLYHADFLGLILKIFFKDIKLIWNIRCSNIDFRQYSPITAIIVKTLSAFSGKPDAVIVNSNSGKKFHQQLGYKPKVWVTINNGFDLNKFSPISSEEKLILRVNMGLNANDIIIGMVARYDYMKGHDLLLEAVDILINSKGCQFIKFVLVGKGIDEYNDKLLAKLDKFGFRDRFVMMGERKDVHKIIPVFDIYISSSLGEGFPNVIGEAMACQVPCVVTDVGDCAVLVGKYGEVVPPQNADLLAQGLVKMILKSEKDRNEIGMRSRAFIKENYTIESISKDYQRLYEKITS